MRPGEIWWASLEDPAGSGPGFRRPLMVVQANEFNGTSRVPAANLREVEAGLRLVLSL